VAKSVIDELIFTLGLDSSSFTRGQKQAAAAMIDTQKTVTSAVGTISSALTSAATKVAGFVLGFEGLKGVINLVRETATQFKNLGITAELLGTSVRNTRIAQEFSQLAGASGNALSSFAQTGRMNLSALTMGRIPQWALPSMIGLNPMTAFNGSPEQVFARWQSAANAHAPQLQRMMPGAQSPQMAVQQFLQMAGLDPALAAEATNRKHAQEDMIRAERTNAKATDGMSEAGRRAANAIIDLRTHVENLATLGFAPLTTATDWLTIAFGDLQKILDAIINGPIGSLFKAIGQDAARPLKWIGKETVELTKEEWGPGGLADQLIHGIANMGHGAVNWVRSLGERDKAFRPIASPLGPLNLVPTPDALMSAMPAVNFGPNTTASLIGPGGQGGSTNNLAIGSVNVHTQATDAAGIAASMRQALARKFSVTQADSGVVA
jgi:hypothetical protein